MTTTEVEPADVDTAHERTRRIRAGLDHLHTLRADIAAAYQHRDWEVLGYGSWSDYVEAEFVGARLRLPRDERRELVGSLREAGMSTRAIASATGVSDGTVRNDMNAGAQNFAAGPPPVTGLDGKSYPQPEPEPEPVEAELVDDEPSETAMPAQPMKPTQRRKPITDQAQAAAWDGRKWAEKVDKIIRDDRRPRNAAAVANTMRGHLQYVRDVVDEALTRLDDDAAS